MLGLLGVAATLLSPFHIGRLLRTISIPQLREHRARSTLTVLGVALGVAVLVAVSITSSSVMQGVNATVDSVAGKAQLQISTASTGFDDSLLDQVRAVDGVYKASPVVQQTATIGNPGLRGERVLVMGVDLLGTEDAYFRDYGSSELDAIRKDSLTFLNSTTNILISRDLAQRFQLKLHDKLLLGTAQGMQAFEVWGFLDSQGVGRAFGGSVAVMYYPAMQEAFGRGQHIDHIDIAVQPGLDPDAVEKRLKGTLGTGFTVERPGMRTQRVANMLAAVHSSLSFSTLIALTAGGFLVFNTMTISIAQRRRELATLRALGITRTQMLKLLTLEGGLVGVVGSALGVGFGIGLSHLLLQITSHALTKVYLQQSMSEVHVHWPLIGIGFAIGILVTAIASAVPSISAASTQVAHALRTGTLTTTQPPRAVTMADQIGCLLIAASLVLMKLPALHGNVPLGAQLACGLLLVAGRLLLPRAILMVYWAVDCMLARSSRLHARLANDNLPRDLGRTSGAATGLMTGVALMIGFATFDNSFLSSLYSWSAQAVPGDLFITSGASVGGMSSRNIPLAPELGDALATIPEVEGVQKIRMADYDFRNYPVKLLSTDTLLWEHYSNCTYLEGDRRALEQERRGKVLVSENFSTRFNVHRGDVLMLKGKHSERAFEVAAVIVDYTSDMGSIIMERTIYKEHWGDERVDTFELHLKRGSDTEAVRRYINAHFGERYDLFVLTNAEFRAELIDAADAIFSIMRIIEYITLVVAALGVVNAVFANVLDRVRELGVLRALGMRRLELSSMVVLEAALVGLVGVVAGATTGAGLGFVILKHVSTHNTGWHLPYAVPWRALWQIAAIVLPISAIAGIYPARHAAHLSVREALEYE